MEKVLIAGASGYLGKCAVRAFKENGYYVRALVRDAAKLDTVKGYVDHIFTGRVTQPETLEGVCDSIDYVFSALGITRQPDNVTYRDVDYGGNKAILELAVRAPVKKFVFTSVFNAHKYQDIELFRVKEKFAEDLRASGIAYSIIRPTSFFSDMQEIWAMAKSGRAYLLGSGKNKNNPIDGNDLARIVADGITKEEKELSVGGPDVYSHEEVARLAFSVLGTEPKITKIPEFIVRFIAKLAYPFITKRKRGGIEFLLTAYLNDFVAPRYAGRSLISFFTELKQSGARLQ